MFTATFKDVSGENYDVQDIKVLNTDGTDYTVNNKVKIQKLSSDGEYGTVYNYRQTKGGWCTGSTFVGRDAVTFANGEGVALFNGADIDLVLQVSGAVDLAPVSTSVASDSYCIIGNMTPVEVDIQDVVPYIGEEICSANNKVKIQKLGADGEYGTVYNWRQSKGGWCTGSTYVGRDALKLAPGEGLAVNNGEASAITLKFPSPLATE